MGLFRVTIGFGWSMGLSISYWPKAVVLVTLPFAYIEIRLGADAAGLHVYWPWNEE